MFVCSHSIGQNMHRGRLCICKIAQPHTAALLFTASFIKYCHFKAPINTDACFSIEICTRNVILDYLFRERTASDGLQLRWTIPLCNPSYSSLISRNITLRSTEKDQKSDSSRSKKKATTFLSSVASYMYTQSQHVRHTRRFHTPGAARVHSAS